MATKRVNKQNQKTIANFFALCIQANTINNYNVFLDYSGHTNSLNFRITKDGFTNIIYNDNIYISGTLFDQKKFDDTLKNWKIQLQDLFHPPIIDEKELEYITKDQCQHENIK